AIAFRITARCEIDLLAETPMVPRKAFAVVTVCCIAVKSHYRACLPSLSASRPASAPASPGPAARPQRFAQRESAGVCRPSPRLLAFGASAPAAALLAEYSWPALHPRACSGAPGRSPPWLWPFPSACGEAGVEKPRALSGL